MHPERIHSAAKVPAPAAYQRFAIASLCLLIIPGILAALVFTGPRPAGQVVSSLIDRIPLAENIGETYGIRLETKTNTNP